MALGARSDDVSRLFLRRGLRLIGSGLILGSIGALAAGRFMADLLYGVPTADPATFAAVCMLLLALGLAACWLPARGASRTDPMAVLRQE